MKISEYLVKMLSILSGPTKWTKYEFFRDENGESIDNPRSKKISSCCLEGCIQMVSRSNKKMIELENIVCEANPQIYNIAGWNDATERTYGDVKRVLRNAIKYAQKLEKE